MTMPNLTDRGSRSGRGRSNQRYRFRAGFEHLEGRSLLSGGFSDSFEGASINPFWSILNRSGSVSLSSNKAHTGSQSVRLDTTSTSQNKLVELFHQFDAKSYGDTSVWFYDTGAGLSSSNYIEFEVTDRAFSR
jgi:hypothetical protein